jgi:NAD(P)-dependent dehydrogenase (short-subunit alcohol dehydrogenase family)
MSGADLANRHAVVTGGGSGIGRATAIALAGAGARVTVMGRRPEPLRELATAYERITAGPCDVTDPEAVAAAFDDARSRQGGIDILVNNAGAAPTAPFHRISAADWRQVMAVNLDAVMYCSQQVLPAMSAAGRGRIVNMASTAALRGYAYVSAYCAAKHAVLGLTRALALESATRGVTVNAVCPGYTDTDIVREGVRTIMAKTGRSEAEALSEFTRSNPQGRLIDVEEVAACVLWLCADSSSAITGQAISVSGGEVM